MEKSLVKKYRSITKTGREIGKENRKEDSGPKVKLRNGKEVTEETHVEKNLPKIELPIWFDGKQINEILLYQTILGINQRDIGRENRSLKMRKLKNY